ncbi:MAG: hypothetical protein JKY09_04675 [Crocinitomicaceae bacterium]|nr:hypothetical protein [Crocinitomicaceae bacterium]
MLYGTVGVDTLTGGLGDDTIYGQGDADSFIHNTGDGSDTLYANINNLATVTFNGVSNSDLLFSANGYNLIVTDTATGESLTLVNQYYQSTYGYKFASVNGINIATDFTSQGTDNADVINGTAQDNSISGGLGNDTLDGQGGNDTLSGGADNDVLYGYTGNDFLFGNAGNDLLDGQWGNDTLNGGAGDDTLTGSSNYDYFVFTGSDSGDDVITDFSAYYDQLQFDSSIFATSAAAVAAFSSGVIDLGGGNSVTLTGITTLLEADVEII